MNSEWWAYENLEPVIPNQGWHESSSQGNHPDDLMDHHLDLGCGRIPKARLGIDRNGNGDILMDLNTGEIFSEYNEWHELEVSTRYNYFGDKISDQEFEMQGSLGVLPFLDNSIESIISHHFFEHLSHDGFINLLDDCYRVLVPGGKLRIIVPMFPSFAAFESSDHKMLIGPETFVDYTGTEDGEHWHESFADPYCKSRFTITAMDYTPATKIAIQDGYFLVTKHGEGERKLSYIDTDMLLPKSRELRCTLTKGN